MHLHIPGPAGQLQLLIDTPQCAPAGIVMISHPQPLLGGTPRHLVPHSIAQRLTRAGWITVRPSFRGVGGSEGSYADGVGEADDAVVIAAHLRAQFPELPLSLVGFSFGAHVYARAACLLEASPAPAHAIVLMGMPVGIVPGGRTYEAMPIPARTLLLHGENDDMAPLPLLLAWGRTTQHPVRVFTGTDHFFKGSLPAAIDAVAAHLARPEDSAI
jgi:alpha/beta superfamily hydrolase